MPCAGEVLASWGGGQFYMPHMITVDLWGFIWVTDVALHQVMKFDASGKLHLTLGTKLSPGSGADFCKPTQVSILFCCSSHNWTRKSHFPGPSKSMDRSGALSLRVIYKLRRRLWLARRLWSRTTAASS